MTAFLSVVGLQVSYGKVEAMRGASLTMREGQIIAVIGSNGAGKTTLLGALMGLLPSRGAVTYDGVDFRAVAPRGISQPCDALLRQPKDRPPGSPPQRLLRGASFARARVSAGCHIPRSISPTRRPDRP